MQTPKFELTTSYRLLGLLLSIYLATVLVISLLSLAWFFKLILFILVSWQTWRAISQHALRIAKQAISQCALDEAGRWHLTSLSGQEYVGQLLGDSLISPTLTILNFKVPHRYFPLVLIILPDAIETNAFRRLRVYLRTAGT